MRRVVITGLGVVSSLGITIDEFWKNLLVGQSRIHGETLFDSTKYRSRQTTVLDYKNVAAKINADSKYNLCINVGIYTIKQALENAGLSDTTAIRKAGFSMATTSDGDLINYLGKITSAGPGDLTYIDSSQLHTIATTIADQFNLEGPVSTFSSACTSGTMSLAYAADIIKYSDTDIMIAGGCDILSEIAFAGFSSLRIISKKDCRPFDANRTGIVIGDGSAILILEEYESAKKRNAPILAEIIGSGISCDAHHTTMPSPDGSVAAIRAAIKDAGIIASDIQYINCHGTGTDANDSCEATGMYKAFQDDLKNMYAGSTKAILGHLLGTAGSIEALITVLVIKNSTIPPVTNLETTDPSVHFKIVTDTPLRTDIKYAMSNSFGFGGNNISMIFKKISE